MEGIIPLGSEFYKTYEFYTISNKDFTQNKIDPQLHKLALARYGGPIAVAKKKNEIYVMSNNQLENCICFYSNDGELKNSILLEEFYLDIEQVMAGFEFIEDELLLLVANTGKYYLLNPYKKREGAQKKQLSIQLPRNQTIIEAKVVENGFVCYTSEKRFYYVNNVFDPSIKELPFPGLTENPTDWLVIPASQSYQGRLQVHVAHPQQGVFVITDEQDVKLFFNSQTTENRNTLDGKPMPEISNIQMMCQTFESDLFAYLTKGSEGFWKVWVIGKDFQGLTLEINQQTNLNQNNQNKNVGLQNLLDKENSKKPFQMHWCSRDCVVLVLKQKYIIVGPGDFAYDTKKSGFFFPEVDGLRIISKTNKDIKRETGEFESRYLNEILRRIPKENYEIQRNWYCNHPGAKLKQAYNSFKNREPLEEEDIKQKKSELAEGVQACLDAGLFELDHDIQQNLLKAASYGKTFLNANQFDHDQLYQCCKFLRVVININKTPYKRVITYQQMRQIKEDILVNIMLRYNLHYQAHQVCVYLDFQKKEQLIPLVYEHWACQKIEEYEEDDVLCQIIKEKLQHQQGISFTEIAHRSIEKGKPELALKLLQLEPENAKRVPVLLSMAETADPQQKLEFYEQAMQEALASKESNFINMVILEMLKNNLDQKSVFEIAISNDFTNHHFIEFLRIFEPIQLDEYLDRTDQKYRQAMNQIRKASTSKNIEHMIAFIKEAQVFFSLDKKSEELADILKIWKAHLESYQEIQKEKAKKKLQMQMTPQEVSSFHEFKLAIEKSSYDSKEVHKLNKEDKLSDRTLCILQARQYIKQNMTIELNQFLNKINHKKIVVPYEIIADIYMQRDERDMALQFLDKMTDLKQQIQIFMDLKEQDRAIQAILKSQKGRSDKKKYLERLMEDYEEPNFVNKIQIEIENLKKK